MPSSPSGTPPGEAVRWSHTTGRCPTRCRCGVGAARKPSRCRAISQRRAPSTSPGCGAALSLAMTARDEAERERAADQARLVAGDYRDPTRSGIGPRAPALRRHTRRRAAAPAPCAPRAISSPRPRCDKASAARLRSLAEIWVRHLADKVAGLGGRRAAPSIGCRACWRRRHRARLSLSHGRRVRLRRPRGCGRA
jgi:hypothetical protein